MQPVRPLIWFFTALALVATGALLQACNKAAESHDTITDEKYAVKDSRLFGVWRGTGQAEAFSIHITPSVLYFVSQDEQYILEFVVDTHQQRGDDGVLLGTVGFDRVGKARTDDVRREARINYVIQNDLLQVDWDEPLAAFSTLNTQHIHAVRASPP